MRAWGCLSLARNRKLYYRSRERSSKTRHTHIFIASRGQGAAVVSAPLVSALCYPTRRERAAAINALLYEKKGICETLAKSSSGRDQYIFQGAKFLYVNYIQTHVKQHFFETYLKHKKKNNLLVFKVVKIKNINKQRICFSKYMLRAHSLVCHERRASIYQR